LSVTRYRISFHTSHVYMFVIMVDPTDTFSLYVYNGVGVDQAVHCLNTDGTTGLRSPAGAKDFPSSLCVQTSSEAHPASYPTDTGVPRG
jgi:hypothetical protein